MAEKERRGFASMDRAKQREIASKGGRAAHEKGTAHEFDASEAREAGRKGGKVAHEKGTAHEFTSQEAREAGRKGGQARSKNAQKQPMNEASSEPAQMQNEPSQASSETMSEEAGNDMNAM
ncbi:MAG TPA: KGG domain-containing protein [Planktothrix sp.]|jgi:general stress protein YciG